MESQGRTCWICFGTGDGPWVRPCKCRGSTQWVHQCCLLRWIRSRPGGSPLLAVRLPGGGLRTLFGTGRVLSVSEGISCPQCRTPYLLLEKQGRFFLGLLERVNWAGSRVLTLFVYISLCVSGFAVLWVHGSLSLLFVVGPEAYSSLLSEEGLGLGFALGAIPLFPIFLVASVLPIVSWKHALGIVGVGSMYCSTIVNQVRKWWLPFLFPLSYVVYSVARDHVFRILGVARKIRERQLASASLIVVETNLVMQEEEEEHEDADGDENEDPSPVQNLATLRSSMTSMTSALCMPFVSSALRALATHAYPSAFGRLGLFYGNVLASFLFIVAKDLLQVLYHLERDRIEDSRSILNFPASLTDIHES